MSGAPRVIRVDNHEPADIVRMFPSSYNISVEALNQAGYADWVWDGAEFKSNLERKTWHDLASDGSAVEEQLMRQLKAHPEAHNRLLIEGAIEPNHSGVLVYARRQGQNVMVGRQVGSHAGLFKRIMGQVAMWSRYMEVYYSASYAATALFLAELYELDQKPEDSHTTFKRYFKTINWNPNRQVSRLLGLTLNDTGLSVKLCEEVIGEFGTVWQALNASPKEWAKIKGISENMARNFMLSIGKPPTRD